MKKITILYKDGTSETIEAIKSAQYKRYFSISWRDGKHSVYKDIPNEEIDKVIR